MPQELLLPRTVALACRIGNDESADYLAYDAALRSELPPGRLPLERFIADGGWPTDVVVRVIDVVVGESTLGLTLAVKFDELVTACGGSPDARPRLAEFELTIDRSTAVTTIA